jgi:hypothetical protein
MRWFRVLVAIVLGAAGACSLTTSLDGLATGPGDAGGVRDAGNDPSDAEIDALRADAASDAGTGEGGGFCATLSPPLTFCDDFDEKPIGFDWAAPTLVKGATRAFDTSTFTSPPNSLSFTLPSLDAGALQSTAAQRKDFTQTLAGITYAFDVRVDVMADGTNAGLAAFRAVDVQGAEVEVRFVLTASGGASLSEARNPGSGFTYRNYGFTRYPLQGEWARVSLDLSFGAGNVATISATLGGMQVLAPTALQAQMAPQALSVVLGFGYVSPSVGGWQAHYDDVTVQTR